MSKNCSEVILKVENLQNFKEKPRTVGYEDALKEIGFGRVQIEILIASFLIISNLTNETMGISFLIPLASCEMDLSESDKGLLSGMIFIGMMIPSYAWGLLAGSRGRRKVLLLSIAGSTIFTTIATFTSNFYLFIICRFFTGFFVAGLSIIYTYIGEFCIIKHRATIISWASVSTGFALTLLPLTAMWILSYDFKFELFNGYKFTSWRVLMLIFIMPGILGGLWILRLPESPKFLLTQNRDEKALEIVQWIYKMNKGDAVPLNIDILEPEPIQHEQDCDKKSKMQKFFSSIREQTVPLLKSPYLKNFAACCFLQFGIFNVAGGLALFLPDILNKMANAQNKIETMNLGICHVPNESVAKNCSHPRGTNHFCDSSINQSVFKDSIYLGIAFTVAYVITSLFMKPKRRKMIIASTLLASSICGFLLNYITLYYAVVVLICASIMLSGINSSIINGATVDIFPTNLRSTVVCLTMVFARIGTTTSSNLIGYLLEHNCELTYHILPAITLLCFIISFALPT
ncbi:hypothetical protein PVAND_005849 [Polypedilum vanderplanki]|uniref:Major facilitator superfamily (MFS) profile domain-containing protein n=1 Tax=Polypedilum vanderplanki TaxID=319348 RepID=A0A9J6C1C7_POLVA|nr:hypothetical protein PVAND_005849 [Polypedilum vanderplanki]